MTLEEILRRFVPHQAGDLPVKPLEPVPPERAPVVMNGMVELLKHLHMLSMHDSDNEKRLDADEKRLSEIERRLDALEKK